MHFEACNKDCPGLTPDGDSRVPEFTVVESINKRFFAMLLAGTGDWNRSDILDTGD